LFWSAVVVCFGVAAVGAVVAVTGYLGASQPAGVVRDYFAALARGDAAGALALGDLPDGTHAWLTDEVLRAQNDIARITDVVLSARGSGNARTVDVQYRLVGADGAVPVADTVQLTRQGRAWRLTPAAVVTHVSVVKAGDRARLAGSAVPSGDVLLFPGALPITFAASALAVPAAQRVVRFSGGGLVVAEPQVTAAARGTVQAALRDALDACLAGKSKQQALCPQPSAGRVVPGSLRGAISGNLSDDLTVGLDSADSGLLDITATARVTGSYQALDFNNFAVTKRGTVVLRLAVRALTSAPGSLSWSA